MAGIEIRSNENFDMTKWVDFIEQAAFVKQPDEKRHIYRVIYPMGHPRCLEMMTETEAKNFLKTHGSWSANCVKMQFVEVIGISRICLERNCQQKDRVVTALNCMADKAEAKYANGWKGVARKIFTVVCNIFISSTISLFINNKNQFLSLSLPRESKSLPFFVGSDANFARLVANSHKPLNYNLDEVD